MRRLTGIAIATLVPGLVGACGPSTTGPSLAVVVETVGRDFTPSEQLFEVPVSISNLSDETSYYVWMGPGGVCTALDRLGRFGWQPGSGTCHPRSAMELRPGQRLDSQLWMTGAGEFRMRVTVGESPTDWNPDVGAPSNAFTVRPLP